MLKPPPERLLRALRALGTAAHESDADLLGRFVLHRDEAAFEELLRRHGDLVLRVCRRHLGSGPDVDDAVQAVFLVLARDAARIGRREALAGWLFRVAYYISRKLMAQNHRRRGLPVQDEDAHVEGNESELDRRELQAIVEDEVEALPDRLRSAVVLCYLEGRSNREAAALLGVPTGTVDSRLAAARRRLHARLLRRGVALAGGVVLESLWTGDSVAASSALTKRVLEAVMQFTRTGSAAGVVSSQVLSLVAGAAPTMTMKRTMLLAAIVLLGTMSGTGITIYHAKADGQPPQPAEKPKAPPAKPAQPKAEPDSLAKPSTMDVVQAQLKQPLGLDVPPGELPFREFLELLQKRFEVPVRIDLAAFARHGVPNAVGLYENVIKLPVVRGMTLADALRDALAQLADPETGIARPLAWRVRNSQILIVPAYLPTMASVGGGPPGGQTDVLMNLTQAQIMEQDEGEPITISVEEKPFTEVLRELRQASGANIVLDAREKEKASAVVSATFTDVRLMAALRILGDMCDLQPVALNNIFYVTSKENAQELQHEIDLRRYGEPQPGLGGGLKPGLGGGLGTSK